MKFHLSSGLAWLAILITSLPLARADHDTPAGQSLHGDVFNEGPRQQAHVMPGMVTPRQASGQARPSMLIWKVDPAFMPQWAVSHEVTGWKRLERSWNRY